MGDEHFDTIRATKSDEFIKSSVENIVSNPSESEGEHECDVPACDDFTTFSNRLFAVNDDFSSSDDESFSDEYILKKSYSNPLFDEEIISIKIDPHNFNAESDLIESLLNQNSSIISSSLKIDSLLDEFAGELTLLKSISLGIDETDCDREEEIHLINRLWYDNSSPHPPEEFDLSFTLEDPMPPALRKMTMTLKGIFSSLKNCLAMILFHFLKMSHFILIFLHPLVLLQNHRIEIQEF
nr:hypothetical protein [Tanacetum cinerariifolium]